MKIKRKGKYVLEMSSKELGRVAAALDVITSGMTADEKGAAIGHVAINRKQWEALEDLMFKVVNVPR